MVNNKGKSALSDAHLLEKIITELREKGKTVKEIHKANGEIQYMAQCIYPEDHKNGDKTPSLSINAYSYKCFNPACRLSKGGSIKDLARRMNIHVENEEYNDETEAVEYMAKRLNTSFNEAKEFMERMNIQGKRYQNKKGILIDLFNGDTKFRSFDDDQEERIYRHFGKSKKPAFSGLLDFYKHNAVFITEGTFDALTFWFNSFPAISTEGKKYSIKAIADTLKDVGIGVAYLAFDNDEAGSAYLEEAVKELLINGMDVYILEIPNGYKDVNECWQKDKQALIQAVKGIQANDAFEYYAKRFDTTDPIRKKMLISKLLALYGKASYKESAYQHIERLLENRGISQEEWNDAFEREDLILAEEAQKNSLMQALEKAKQELRYNNVDAVINELQETTLRNYNTVEVHTIDEMSTEEILNDQEKIIKCSLLPRIDLYPSDMLLISAQTKNGKTTLALNIARDFLLQGQKVLYVTYELPKSFIARMFMGIEVNKFWRDLTREEIEAVKDMYKGRFAIEQKLEVNALTAYVRTFKPDVFIVDYDERVLTRGTFVNEERRVSYITNTLKNVAMDMENICVLLSQEDQKGDHARYSREKEFFASVHLHLEKSDDALNYDIKLNRYGSTESGLTLDVNWETKRIEGIERKFVR